MITILHLIMMGTFFASVLQYESIYLHEIQEGHQSVCDSSPS